MKNSEKITKNKFFEIFRRLISRHLNNQVPETIQFKNNKPAALYYQSETGELRMTKNHDILHIARILKAMNRLVKRRRAIDRHRDTGSRPFSPDSMYERPGFKPNEKDNYLETMMMKSKKGFFKTLL